MPTPDGQSSAANRRAMVAVMLAVALATLDTAIANTALPAIAADLHCAPAESVWVINAYQLAMVATVLPFAALGDVVGHRRIYIGGLIMFTASSLACAVGPTLASLAIARILQGLGGSAITSVGIALVRSLYPHHRLGRGVGTNALDVGVSKCLGRAALLAQNLRRMATRATIWFDVDETSAAPGTYATPSTEPVLSPPAC